MGWVGPKNCVYEGPDSRSQSGRDIFFRGGEVTVVVQCNTFYLTPKREPYQHKPLKSNSQSFRGMTSLHVYIGPSMRPVRVTRGKTDIKPYYIGKLWVFAEKIQSSNRSQILHSSVLQGWVVGHAVPTKRTAVCRGRGAVTKEFMIFCLKIGYVGSFVIRTTFTAVYAEKYFRFYRLWTIKQKLEGHYPSSVKVGGGALAPAAPPPLLPRLWAYMHGKRINARKVLIALNW